MFWTWTYLWTVSTEVIVNIDVQYSDCIASVSIALIIYLIDNETHFTSQIIFTADVLC